MLKNLRHILAIELLCACQGIDLLSPLKTGTLAMKAYDAVRAVSSKVAADRPLSPDVNAVAEIIERAEIAKIVS